MAKSKEFIELLPIKAREYVKECMGNTKTHVAGSGKVVQVQDRHIPTVGYFLNIWLYDNIGETINRSTYYDWLKQEDNEKSNTIKEVDTLFKDLAVDIVANEGKGIFYAKNRLGMHDKQHIEQKSVDKFDFDGNDD